VLLNSGTPNPDSDVSVHLPITALGASSSWAKLIIFPLNVTSLIQPTNESDIDVSASTSGGTPPKKKSEYKNRTGDGAFSDLNSSVLTVYILE